MVNRKSYPALQQKQEVFLYMFIVYCAENCLMIILLHGQRIFCGFHYKLYDENLICYKAAVEC